MMCETEVSGKGLVMLSTSSLKHSDRSKNMHFYSKLELNSLTSKKGQVQFLLKNNYDRNAKIS